MMGRTSSGNLYGTTWLRLTERRDFFIRGDFPHESPVRQQKRSIPRRGIDITRVISISTSLPKYLS
jgi:hypothetical protein